MTEEWYFFIVIFIFIFQVHIYMFRLFFTMVYYKILNIIPLIFMSISVPIPFCFDYYSFVALSSMWKGYASSCMFFSSVLLLATLVFLWLNISFRIIHSISVEKCPGNFDRGHIKSVGAIGIKSILTMLYPLPIQEHGIPLSFLWITFNVLYQSFIVCSISPWLLC